MLGIIDKSHLKRLLNEPSLTLNRVIQLYRQAEDRFSVS